MGAATTLDATPLHPVIGTEVHGVDARSAGPAQGRLLRALILEHPLLVLRAQQLDPPRLVRFTRLFGEPLRHPPHPAYPDLPELAPLSNRPDQGRVPRPYWHTDGLLRPDPPRLTLFYAAEVPESGGDTLFIDSRVAFDALEPDDRRLLEGLTAVFPTGTTHPLVLAHPETGRKALCANLGGTVGLVGVTRRSAMRLLEQLAAHYQRPESIYRHRYRPGDLLIWDNLAIAHSATEPPPADQARLMLRTDVGR